MRTLHTLALLLALSAAAACGDDTIEPPSTETTGDAGHSKPDASAADSGNTDNSECPDTAPAAGEPCSGMQRLCTYKHRGPCPPDPDQLRVCHDGKWAITAPLVACEGRHEDAGSN
jgi:hypothetical protein